MGDPEKVTAFSTLINLVMAPLILLYSEPSASTKVRMDTSGHGIDTVLAQHQRGQAYVIAYASQLLSPPELNYSITERECLALVC